VKKLPFDLETCIRTRYDVTKPQPQLFVCEHFDELTDAVNQLSARMAYRVGGVQSLHKAVQSGRTATAVYSSGLQTSGTFTRVLETSRGEGAYLQTTGATGLAMDGKQLPAHGKDVHRHGFGSPIGRLSGETKPLETFTDADLDRTGIRDGHTATLQFEGGVTVCGRVAGIVRQQGKIVLISFTECLVKCQGETLFAPSWGVYDMAVGEQIVSVFAGAADDEAFFGESPQTASPPQLIQTDTDQTRMRNWLYQSVRDVREGRVDDVILGDVAAQLDQTLPDDWLLRLEILELLLCHGIHSDVTRRLREQLLALQADEELHDRIQSGLALLPACEAVATGVEEL
jgi:phenylalanine-4-hydroxylase